jgi:hypothetical protein
MKRAGEKLGDGLVINDGDDQIVAFPPNLRFRGTLVRIGRSDAGIYIEALTPKPRARNARRPKKTSNDKGRGDRA